MNNWQNDGKATACLKRTCDHQFKNCTADAGGNARDGSGRTGGKVVRDKRGKRLEDVVRTSPVTQPTPNVQPRPTTTGSSGTNGGGQPVVRDHRVKRAGSGWGIR
jgi:hypothetical protein